MLRKSMLMGLLVGAFVTVPLVTLGQDYEDYIIDEEPESGEPKRTVPSRGVARFSFESETVEGIWAEVGAFYSDTKSDAKGVKSDFDGPQAFGRVSYGQKMWEAGLFFPFYNDLSGDFNDVPHMMTGDVDSNGIGDLQAYGKFIPLQTKVIEAGGGFLVSFPTGDDDDAPRAVPAASIGTGEFGFLPYFTAQVNLAVAQVRGHIGYEWFTANNNDRAVDRLVYGFGIFLPLFDYVTFRNEFAGTELDKTDDAKLVSYLGGLDIRVPIGEFDVLLRPTGIAGIAERSPDWGVGGSIAVSSATYR